MPVVINQLPSGAVQYPIVQRGPTSAEINAGNAAMFMNARPDSQADTAAMLALVQYLLQGKQMNLERELRRDELGQRREEIIAMLKNSALDRQVAMEDRDIWREELGQRGEQFRDELELQREQLKASNAIQQQQFNYQNSQLEIMREAQQQGFQNTTRQFDLLNKQTQSQMEDAALQRRAMEKALSQGEVSNTLPLLTGAAEAEATGKLSVAEDTHRQAMAEAAAGFSSGALDYDSYRDTASKKAFDRLIGGESIDDADVESITKGLKEETSRIARDIEGMDPNAAAGLMAKHLERLRAIRSSVASPDTLSTWWERFTSKNVFSSKAMPVSITRQKQISDMVDASEQVLRTRAQKIGKPLPSVANVENYQQALAPGLMRRMGTAKADVLQGSADRRANILGALGNNPNRDSLIAAYLGTDRYKNGAPVMRLSEMESVPSAAGSPPPIIVPSTRPADDEFPTLLQGLR